MEYCWERAPNEFDIYEKNKWNIASIFHPHLFILSGSYSRSAINQRNYVYKNLSNITTNT
ncbi:hypothetical protein T01_2889 [Trichinella spiralis]|uniref:Uncharacterized protein n=1 Tax=Trichinella spiralis TaxID=6334 RepID=A0A0V1BCV0_TRISP|nr:hypothetical protein T01_2889 [Trichinella spiralis]